MELYKEVYILENKKGENNMYTIYMHRNKINNKVYIGQTQQLPQKRWGTHGEGYKTSSKFYNAIQKYGWDNFEHLILFTNLTQEEANIKEEELIKLYRATEDKYGYNIKQGGNNYTHSQETKDKIGRANSVALKGKKWTKEQRELMAKKMSGSGNPFYGKHHSEETKQKISQNRKGKLAGADHPFYGQHHSEATKQKISASRQSKHGKAVRCINTGEIFPTMMDAARWCGLANSSTIGQVCNQTGKQKTAGKHPITHEKLQWEFITDDTK